MAESEGRIPPFREDGYLPEGLHLATEAEITFRFGTGGSRRRRLVMRVRRWASLGRQVGALRMVFDGSFVTAKAEPNDVDAVVLLPVDFGELADKGWEAALELEEMLLTRRPEEIFGADNEVDFEDWIEFFSRTREADGRRKGLVELKL